ncbi:MAG: UbiX family flavin prenyltransferase [Bacteroidales bacterium]|jgi:4-hydroxy-3-polyprenylbenzoate decarboxylase|nr:UbiX family flavin prenyltransferase [Bacteroidales bacterium]
MKIAVAITGASGALYAQLLLATLQRLRTQLSEVGIVFTSTAKQIWHEELHQEIDVYSFTEYENSDFYAPFASGSAQYDALVVCPCSMGTLGRVAHGISDSLITRAADVMLKERKKLILVPREMPYNLIHIKNMELLTQAGAIICPANPTFYTQPHTIEELCQTVVDRVIDLLGLETKTKRWGNTMSTEI